MRRGKKPGFVPPLTIISNGTAHRATHAKARQLVASGKDDMEDAREDVLLRLALYGAASVSVTKNARGDVLGVEAIPPDRIVLLPDGSAGVRVDREPDGTLTFLSCPFCGGKGTLRATSTWKDGTVTTTDEPCFRCKGKGRI